MSELGISFSLEAVECQKKLPMLVRTIEAGSLANLKSFDGDWTFHRRKEDPFNWDSPSSNLLNPDQIKLILDNERMKKVLLSRPPKIVSFHLGHSARVMRKVPPDNHDEAIREIPGRQEVFTAFYQSLGIIRESFLVQELHLPVALENLDYHPSGAYEYVCQPDFINQIFREYPDLYLLLDIAHASISAMALLGGDPQNRLDITKNYLTLLPLDRVIEIHINSPTFENGQLLDSHFPIDFVEVKLLSWLLSRGLPNLKVIDLECEQNIERQIYDLHLVKGGR